MKKVLAILLAIAMIAAMAACAQKAAPADETKTSGETTSQFRGLFVGALGRNDQHGRRDCG